MRSHGLPKIRVVGHSDLVERSQIQGDEPLPLFFADVETPMHRDQVVEASKLTSESVRSAEGLRRERGQVIDVVRLSLAEQWLQQRIRKHAVVERVLKSVEGFLTA
jgi:hypothetical protein